ncbi:DUF6923 family protein [Prauserella cavernicola]|uniref:DUF6923 domain-containing protein n=1 Tax=Prauserella cavernicola TaxID=2800127 RepID=A0A934V3C7_9PSEU|nr:hypothetical protein [Prauserella cavernicola]MBK1782845.1 hypothetical protein [Prauserella cavernicola]
MSSRLPLGLAVLVLLGGSAPPLAGAGPDPEPWCPSLRVENRWTGGPSRLSRVDLPGGEVTPLRVLEYSVNAIGYAREQELVYGVAGRHVVVFDRVGRLTVAGRAPVEQWGGLVAPRAATVVGNRWYVAKNHTLYTVDVDRGSPGFLRVTGEVRLSSRAAGELDDLDADPRTGLLYGVGPGYPRSVVVRVDPRTGATAVVDTPALPPGTSWGAVSFGPDGALYALASLAGGRARLYRIPLTDAGPVAEVSSGPALRASDATGCLLIPEPAPPPSPPPPTTPPSPTPTPTRTPTPGPSRTPTPTPTPTMSPAPSVSRPPPATPPETPEPPPPAPAPPPAGAAPPPPPPEDTATDLLTPTEEKRRWALTMLLIAFGAGAAARGLRRR